MAVYKDKKTGKWNFRVYVTDPITNKRFQIQRNGFDLKRDAVDEESKLSARYQNKEILLSEIKFKELIEEYLIYQEKRVKPTTYTNYIYMIDKHILPSFKDFKVNQITRLNLEKWYLYIDSLEITNNYKNKILSRFKDIFNYCEDQYDLRLRYLNTFPPFKTDEITEHSKNVVIYDLKTFNIFIEHSSNDLEKTLFSTMFYTGMRVGELRALTWEDVNLKKNQIRVNKQVTTKIPGKGPTITTPKTKSGNRTISIPNILVDILQEWFCERSSKNGFKMSWQVFGDLGFTTENRIRRMVKRISTAANTPYITLHGFRHSYTSLLYSLKIDPKIMQIQAGHSSINVTLDVYTHLNQEDSKKTIIDVFEKENL